MLEKGLPALREVARLLARESEPPLRRSFPPLGYTAGCSNARVAELVDAPDLEPVG